MSSPFFPVVLMRVDDAANGLVHEEPVDGLGRGQDAAGSWGTLEVVVGKQVKDGKGERVDAVLCVIGDLYVGESVLCESEIVALK